MTPKEMTKDLHDKHFPLCSHIDPWDKAKQGAMICVDTILKTAPTLPSNGMDPWKVLRDANEYWKEVKSEIEKL